MTLDLVPIWTIVLALAVIMYVLLDGFDLGVGILFPFAPDDHARDLMMASVAPIWDGNETWLVLGGIALFAAFPLAFAIIIPAVYFPILAMLLGLIFRGVAFEFRHAAQTSRARWDQSFFLGLARRDVRARVRARQVRHGVRRRAAASTPARAGTGSIRSCWRSASGSCSATCCWARRGSC